MTAVVEAWPPQAPRSSAEDDAASLRLVHAVLHHFLEKASQRFQLEWEARAVGRGFQVAVRRRASGRILRGIAADSFKKGCLAMQGVLRLIWRDDRGWGPYLHCPHCNKTADTPHVLSDPHLRKVASAASDPDHVESAKPVVGVAGNSEQGPDDVLGQPRALAVGHVLQGPQSTSHYIERRRLDDWEDDYGFCLLCGKWATQMHLESTKHRQRATRPELYLANGQQEVRAPE
eukprot:UN3049